MKFEKILKSFREGQYIARKSDKDNDNNSYTIIYYNRNIYNAHYRKIWTIEKLRTSDGHEYFGIDSIHYLPIEDIFADDWEIVNKAIIENIFKKV